MHLGCCNCSFPWILSFIFDLLTKKKSPSNYKQLNDAGSTTQLINF